MLDWDLESALRSRWLGLCCSWAKRILAPLAAVIAFVVDAHAFFKLIQGSRGSIVFVTAILSSVTVVGVVCYIGFRKTKSRVYTSDGFPHRVFAYPKLYKPARALLALLIIAVLGGGVWLYWQARVSRGKVIVLVADFGGEDPLKYRVTEHVLLQLRQSLAKYDDTIIRSLGKSITEQQGPEIARAAGKDYQAAIVLWGYYGITNTDVMVTVHVENLSSLKRLPITDSKVYAARGAIPQLNSFQFQQQFSQEMGAFTLFVTGLIRLEANDYGEAGHRFTEALALGQWAEDFVTKSLLLFSRAVVFMMLEDYPHAVADTSEALRINPKYADAYNVRAMACTKLQKFDEAISDYSKAIEINPQNAGVYHNRGLTFLFSRRYPEAVEDYNHAIEINSGEPLYYYGRGVAYTLLEKNVEAITDLSQTIKMRSDDSQAYYYRGLNLIHIEKYQDAIHDLSCAIQIAPSDAANYLVRGMAYAGLDDHQKAIEQFTKAIQLDARLDIAYALRATAYTRIKKYDEALADLDTVRKITNNTELRENTEHLIQVTQKLRNAANELQRVQEELRQLGK